MNIKRIQNFGFTLVELLTVVVIIGILSTVGLPAYQTYSVSTKMAEATVTISSIQKSEITYQSQNDYFISLYRSDNTRPPQ
jgi:prepilin-type N-terminal cleavage/methylation domain-containing protein